jgi:hypothetical protein
MMPRKNKVVFGVTCDLSTNFKEQRVCINLCLKLGKTASETCDILELTFGEEAATRTQYIRTAFAVQNWNEFS